MPLRPNLDSLDLGSQRQNPPIVHPYESPDNSIKT
jgi:hypothetical protein